MRTGAIFARGSCRALKWMALFGVVFALGAGQAAAQVTFTVTVEEEDTGYSKRVLTVVPSEKVWGNVSATDFSIDGNNVASVAGIPMGSPGTDKFTVTFHRDIATTDTLDFDNPDAPAEGATDMRMFAADGTASGADDADDDPDPVDDVDNAAITEAVNAPALPALDDLRLTVDVEYTAAKPAATLPEATANSGVGDISYALVGAPSVLTLDDGSTTPADARKLLGTLTSDHVGMHEVTYTATDTNSAVARRNFTIHVMEPLEKPGVPTDLTAMAGDGEVTLSWMPPADGGAVASYEYDIDASDDWMDAGMSPMTVTGLTNGTRYVFRVRAVNATDPGDPTAGVAAIPTADPEPLALPGTPQNLTVAAGDAQVTLRWEAPSSGGAVASYQYDMAANGNWMSAGTGTTTTVSGLTNGTAYAFRVRAMNATGPGEPTGAVTATPVAAGPSGPQVTVKEVKANTSVPESGGLEVTVVANVPAGTKVDGKVAPIASKTVMVSFSTASAEIKANEEAETGQNGDVRVLTSPTVWNNIPRTDQASEQTYKFRLAIGQDLDAEDEKFQVSVSIDGAAKMSKVIMIDDAQEQTYDLSLPSSAKGKIKEGMSGTLTLKAVPAKTFDIPVTLALNPNDPSKYTLSASSGTFGTGSFATTVGTKADGDRDDDTITVSAYTSGTLGNDVKIAEVDITIEDVNALPAVKATLVDDKGKALDPQPESVMEGETVKVMLTAVDKDGKNMKAAEKLTITLMPTGTADTQDYRLSSQSFEIAKGKESSAAVDLMVTENQDVGEETLMFDAAVAGESKMGTEKRSVAGVLSLMITDGTEKLVWANSQEDVEAAVYAAKNAGAGDDMTFTEGEMIEVMGALLFSSAPGVTVSYTAESDMSGVASTSVSGGTVMVTAVSEGTAHITITAHASMPSGVKIVDQTDPGMASIMFPVEVGLEALSIELMGPEDMNLAEGMSAMVTATANRAVTEEVTVMLMHDRSMSSAGVDDFTADAITIAAGMSSGTTMVMAVEDNMAEDMEELVLYGMTEGMAGEVTGNVKLYLWDAAVPALPVIAQLLLAAFLAVGGYRRYRRR